MLYFNRRALIATMTVLKLINMAPAAGLIKIPKGKSMPAARGMVRALYPVAQTRFCIIFLYVAFQNRIK